MTRPRKNNAEYFSHDTDASSDEKIIYLESKFGLAGYAFYFKMLEVLSRSEDFTIERLDEIKIVISNIKSFVFLIFNRIFKSYERDCTEHFELAF